MDETSCSPESVEIGVASDNAGMMLRPHITLWDEMNLDGFMTSQDTNYERHKTWRWKFPVKWL